MLVASQRANTRTVERARKCVDSGKALKLYLCHFSIDSVHFDTVVDSICFGTNEINFPVGILLRQTVAVFVAACLWTFPFVSLPFPQAWF